jgi:3-deoxy-D-manno-octulosonic-acid transferase
MIYQTAIAFYGFLIRVAALFNPKARLWVAGRQNWQTRLTQQFASNTAPVIWLHAASLGEFEQARPVLETLRQQHADHKILVTFFSPSGYEVRKNYAGADVITYLPLDTPANARQFLAIVKPRLALFVKYEFWANYLLELKAQSVPTVLFSAVFRPQQMFFRWYGGFQRRLLTCFNHILVQDKNSVLLLKSVGYEAVTLAGDTRFDRVAATAANKQPFTLVEDFCADVPTLIAGSVWPDDMAVLIPFLNQFTAPLQVIIAPHEIDDEQISYWRKQLIKPSRLYSELAVGADYSAQILFIDNVGMLASLYQYGQFAFVGGGFKRGGLHNILEPATFGLPIFFGPAIDKFPEALVLVSEGGAFLVANDFQETFQQLYLNTAERDRAGAASRDYVLRNIGATSKVVSIVNTLLR